MEYYDNKKYYNVAEFRWFRVVLILVSTNVLQKKALKLMNFKPKNFPPLLSI